MSKLIYSKFSNDRDMKFRIVTKIYTTDSEKYVIKEASDPKAIEHVANIVQNVKVLTEKYKDSRIRFAQSEYVGTAVKIEWIKGRSYSEYLDELLKQSRIEQCIASIWEYFKEFFLVEDFLKESFHIVKNVDIDMLFNNVIYENGYWTDYDYEWFMENEIPVEFLIYRCLLYYITTKERAKLLEYDIYGIFGITEEKKEKYSRWESELQNYIQGDIIPLWKLYSRIRGSVIDVLPIVERTIRQKVVRIYYDYGNDFSEKDSVRVFPKEYAPNKYRLEIECPSTVKRVRLDPAWCSCLIEVYCVRNEYGDDIPYKINGYDIGNNFCFFDHNDPQICVSIQEKSVYIEFDYYLCIIDVEDEQATSMLEGMYEELHRKALEREGLILQHQNDEKVVEELIKQRQENVNTIEDLRNGMQILNVQNQQLNSELISLQQSFSWKVTKPFRKIKQIVWGNFSKER